MRIQTGVRSLAVLLLLTLALAVPSTSGPVTAEDATPTPSCGVHVPLDTPSEARPAGVTRQSLEAPDYLPVPDPGDGFVVSIVSKVCIEPGTVVTVVDDDGTVITEHAESGSATIVVVSGDLGLTVLRRCVATQADLDAQVDCSTDTGLALVMRAGATDWVEIPVGTSALEHYVAGDTVMLARVTINVSTGKDQTVLMTTGAYHAAGGGGCTRSCWQFP